MSSDLNEQAEIARQLKAAAEGRYRVNQHSRYVLQGEKQRPVRKVREMLERRQWISWHSQWSSGYAGMRITDEGRQALALIETPARQGQEDR